MTGEHFWRLTKLDPSEKTEALLDEMTDIMIAAYQKAHEAKVETPAELQSSFDKFKSKHMDFL